MRTAALRNMRRICGGDPDGKIQLLLDDPDRPDSERGGPLVHRRI